MVMVVSEKERSVEKEGKEGRRERCTAFVCVNGGIR